MQVKIMKKIKIFIATLFCLMCLCLALSGCSTVTGEYVKGSLHIKGTFYSSNSHKLTVYGSFDVELPQAGTYEVSYNLVQVNDEGDATSEEKSCTTSITTNETTYTVDFVEDIATDINKTSIHIKNVNIKLVNEKKEQSNYVEGSLKVSDCTYSSSSNRLTVYGSFDVKLPKTGEYKISYVLVQTNAKGEPTGAEKKCSATITTNKKEYTVEFLSRIDTMSNSTNVNIKDVTAKLVGDETGHDAYAIGFGVTGAVLLGGLITVFVLDKLGKFKKNKKD